MGEYLPDDSPDKPRILNLAAKAWDLVDTSGVSREAFSRSCGEAVTTAFMEGWLVVEDMESMAQSTMSTPASAAMR